MTPVVHSTGVSTLWGYMPIKMISDGPTFKEVSKLLRYDPIKGELYWKVRVGTKIRAGQRAGSDTKNGYRQVKIKTSKGHKPWLEHHIAWLLYYKKWPNKQLDHKDTNGQNNKINNLRKSTQSQNMSNRVSSKKVGRPHKYKGVFKSKRHGWGAAIRINRKNQYLGYFTTIEEAALAYNIKAMELFGEFAYLNKIKVKLSKSMLRYWKMIQT